MMKFLVKVGNCAFIRCSNFSRFDSVFAIGQSACSAPVSVFSSGFLLQSKGVWLIRDSHFPLDVSEWSVCVSFSQTE